MGVNQKEAFALHNFTMHIFKITSFYNVYHQNIYISSFTDKYYTMEYIHANRCVYTHTQKYEHIM